MCPVKEPHYFSEVKPDRNLEFVCEQLIPDQATYLKLFDQAGDAPIIGEASTSYLWAPQAAQRIQAQVPHAKIIIMLREPVSRAYSHYLNDLREGYEPRPPLQAFQEDYQSPRKGWGVNHLYVDLGFYTDQIARYYAVFPQDQILVIFFEELVTDPPATLARVLTFLGLEPNALDAMVAAKVYNAYAVPRTKLIQLLLGSAQMRFLGRLFPKRLRQFIRGQILFKKATKPTLDLEAQNWLTACYRAEWERLPDLLARPLPWSNRGMK